MTIINIRCRRRHRFSGHYRVPARLSRRFQARRPRASPDARPEWSVSTGSFQSIWIGARVASCSRFPATRRVRSCSSRKRRDSARTRSGSTAAPVERHTSPGSTTTATASFSFSRTGPTAVRPTNPDHARAVAEAFPPSTVGVDAAPGGGERQAAGGRDRRRASRLERRRADAGPDATGDVHRRSRPIRRVPAGHEGLPRQHRDRRLAHVRGERLGPARSSSRSCPTARRSRCASI